MRLLILKLIMTMGLGVRVALPAGITPEQAAQLPPPANHNVNFSEEIRPIFEASCIKCHGRGRNKGGLRLDTRETLLQGGESGPAVLPGNSRESRLIALVQGIDPDSVMPKKGSRLTSDQISLLRAWIDQGAPWDAGVSFGRLEPLNLKPRLPNIPPGPKSANPVDRFLDGYFVEHKITTPEPLNDRWFARRVSLDVTGLLPPADELKKFVGDKRADKRERLVRRLLADGPNYAQHWLSFWNDLLRNDYKGTGYIDGGRKQITPWLYSALLTNMPYDRFVAELINPTAGSEGFSQGIVWRGVVNASQTPQMQAAQGISQVFMGVNLKCASCHDSFINDLTLADAYGLAGIYANGPLEMVHCDKPTGKTAELKFIYPELGAIDPQADKTARLKQLAEMITQRQDGRLTRTIVNRLWQKFMGRGLIEPVDDMEKPAWHPDLLDWLAEDFAAHHYDMKRLIERIVTSRAYQLPAVDPGDQDQRDFVFRGPLVRRMSAEEFRDALRNLTGIGYSSRAAEIIPSKSEEKRFALPKRINWMWNDPQAAEKAKVGHVYFRRIVQLPVVPEEATSVIVCDDSFKLFVNGQEAGSGSDSKKALLFDVRKMLKQGANLFAIDAVNHLADGTAPNPTNAVPGTENPAGLLFYARLRHTGRGAQRTKDLVSDSSWLCSEDKCDHWQEPGFAAEGWGRAVELGDIGILPWHISRAHITTRLAAAYARNVRASLVAGDSLMMALGRPNREQVVTTRQTVATTLQALEMTNGETLADLLKRGAANLLADPAVARGKLIATLYEKALSRRPSDQELKLAREIVGQPAQPAGVEDLLWAVTMLPEFQLIY